MSSIMPPYTWWPSSSADRPWDDGLRWHLEQSADEAPDFASDPLQLDFVRDQHLRAVNGDLENAYIEHLIRASYRQAQRYTQRSLIPETRRMVLNGFPWGAIEFPWPPLLSVEVDYTDAGGAEGTLSGSPADYDIDAPSGPYAKRGRIATVSGSSWPSTADQSDAVVVTFVSGYEVVNGVASIPEDITDARLLWIAERYKQRSLSDHASNQNKAIIQARTMWMDYRVY